MDDAVAMAARPSDGDEGSGSDGSGGGGGGGSGGNGREGLLGGGSIEPLRESIEPARFQTDGASRRGDGAQLLTRLACLITCECTDTGSVHRDGTER